MATYIGGDGSEVVASRLTLEELPEEAKTRPWRVLGRDGLAFMGDNEFYQKYRQRYPAPADLEPVGPLKVA